LKQAADGERWVLSLAQGLVQDSEQGPQALSQMAGKAAVTVLSGPEGGLSPAEEAAALSAGFRPVTLGPRVLRAETAPLAVLAALSLGA
jgi:16S rRNA (uracil1498-N3)-methyltransferase